MHQSSLQYMRCVKCGHSLDLKIFEEKNEIIEGLLSCIHCEGIYPIISSIPFLVEDLSLFFSIRAKLGGYLLLHVKDNGIKSIIKKSLQEIKKVGDDITDLEKNWVTIYQKSKPSAFQTRVKHVINKLSKCNFIVEHGCSIGTMSEILAKRHGTVFGIDKSFFALLEAKKHKINNADFFLADSLSKPFGTMKFDLVVALNVLELIEPIKLLKIIKQQAKKFVILSDPYDYERGKSSVKVRLDEKSLRINLTQSGFKLIGNTGKPNFTPWNLIVNPRLELNYKVDLILAFVQNK
ncbi:MAG TPA: class I SAM-dependent methyltransferase [Candidatus Nitrosotalea sp.]|nr:class I SAM-dependent methyltransferase [Candidatus Nitrosotalea sp.]